MKAKAKAKKKQTVYVVACADYNKNEHKDNVGCYVFGDVYGTANAAHKAIMDDIKDMTLDYVWENDLTNGEHDATKRVMDECIRDGLLYNDTCCVHFEQNDVEYVYVIEKIEV